ncbi:DUF2280 domain-containing protein [Pectobacterium zantedeschiae]|uniref:DUF2280 domain-containing protein n=1 Tax=Pectobacterium zantedeschiae TaxID=2034769 RepID=A0A9X8JJH3_9GAMM|nr:DUF2280 domain-containing protein [Pectobacterium zantedeschiae]RYC44616.1 DUF2280 domain-containing protein [Pectobacterium zantedeschiae]RYC49774.1 hypothetical protein CTN06_02050 [Pectobacterium zantedeschiae]
MAVLKSEVKAFIIQSLACFDTPSQVVESVQKEFGIKVSRQQIESHDPTKVSGKKLAKKWVDMFNESRKRFQNEISDIPIANKAYRLRALNRMAVKAEEMKNFGMTAQLLEQAAKDVGDVYTNKQKVEQSVVATHNVMPVPSCDSVEGWEAAAQKQQSEVLGG